MQNQLSNPCIRCGKERIVVKTWKEQIGDSILVHTAMSCPDADCQRIVNKQLAIQQERSQMAKNTREQRKIDHQTRLRSLHNARLVK